MIGQDESEISEEVQVPRNLPGAPKRKRDSDSLGDRSPPKKRRLEQVIKTTNRKPNEKASLKININKKKPRESEKERKWKDHDEENKNLRDFFRSPMTLGPRVHEKKE